MSSRSLVFVLVLCLLLPAIDLLTPAWDGSLAAEESRLLPDPSVLRAGDPEGKRRALARIATIRDQRFQMATTLSLAAPYYTVADGDADLIVLNRFSETIDFELTARSPEGAQRSLGFHRAEPLAYVRLSLDQLLADGRRQFARGSLRLDFSGDKEMLQAWVVLDRGGQLTELPLSLVGDSQPWRRYAFWDLNVLPAGFDVAPRFYLANFGDQPLQVAVITGVDAEQQRHDLQLAAGAQTVFEPFAAGRREAVGWVLIQSPRDAAGLMVNGLLEGDGFLARLPLDGGAAMSVEADYQAVRVPLQTRSEQQAGYPRRAVVSLFNAGRQPLDAAVEVIAGDGQVLARSEERIAGSQVRSVDLGELLAGEGVQAPEVRVRVHSGSAGLLVNGLIFDLAGAPVEIELVRAEKAHYGGIYPIPSLVEHEVTTTVVNLGETSARVVGQLVWEGGEYAFGPFEVAAGAWQRIDIEALARSQQPDLMGRTIDPELAQAFLQWTVQGIGSQRLIGRTQVRPRFAEDSYGFNCHGCCEKSPWGELIPGSLSFPAGGSGLFQACEYIGTCTTILGPYAASISALNYASPLSWNGTTASSSTATSQVAGFEGWGQGVEYDGYDCLPYYEPIEDEGPVCVINVQVLEASLPNDRIQVKLDAGGASKSGTLTVTLKGPNTRQVFNGAKANGTHNIPLNRDSIPTNQEFTSVEAKWVVSGQTKTGTKNYHFKALGSYSNTRYNTPNEGLCSGGTAQNCYRSGGCVSVTCTPTNFVSHNVRVSWLAEVEENGSGYRGGNFFSREGVAACVITDPFCAPPDLRQVPNPCPACGGTLTANVHVAIRSSNPNLSCGNQVYVSNVGTRTVRDHGGGLSNTQLDHYNGTSGCNNVGGSIGSRKVFKLF